VKFVWSRITSHATVKWSEVKSNVTKSTTVDLGSISASSQVMFLYRSDSQVYMLYMMTRQQFKQLPQKLTILVWRFVFLMVLLFYLHFIYVTIRMHLCSICNRRTTDVRYDMMWYNKTASVSVTHTHTRCHFRHRRRVILSKTVPHSTGTLWYGPRSFAVAGPSTWKSDIRWRYAAAILCHCSVVIWTQNCLSERITSTLVTVSSCNSGRT